jgi:RHS repeat-associated protein
VQSSPGSGPANGAKRYTYNTAGFLIGVETFEGGWQDQARMAYDGLGRRLEMTGYADGQSVTTQYTYDNSQPLIASAADLETTYLYGLGPIAELTDSWAYSLPDGTNTPRQLTNTDGEVTFTASYTPWGDTLAVSGTGNITFGYFGGVMDAATGLLYVGNGQYYDPATGRFLTRDARSDQTNPYVPWKSDATALLIAPMVLLSLVYSRRRGKRTKWDGLFILLVLSVSVSMSLAACSGNQQEPTSHTVTITQAPFGTVIALDGTDIGSVGTPAGTVFNTPKIVCWMTFKPTTTTILAAYGIKLEAEEDWPSEWINAIYDAAQKIGYRFSNILGGTNIGAYNKAIGPVTFVWCLNGGGGNKASGCRYYEKEEGMSKGGRFDYQNGEYTLYFWRISEIYEHNVKMFIHELGHVKHSRLGNADLPTILFDRLKVFPPNSDYDWQQHPCSEYKNCNEDSELFADVFIAWIYDQWNISYPDAVKVAREWMDVYILGKIREDF